jgi:hypothetical protein
MSLVNNNGMGLQQLAKLLTSLRCNKMTSVVTLLAYLPSVAGGPGSHIHGVQRDGVDWRLSPSIHCSWGGPRPSLSSRHPASSSRPPAPGCLRCHLFLEHITLGYFPSQHRYHERVVPSPPCQYVRRRHRDLLPPRALQQDLILIFKINSLAC